MRTVRKVVFQCRNCNAETEKDILPTRHAILGALSGVNRKATCCRKPDYEDLEGYEKARREQKLKDFIPGTA